MRTIEEILNSCDACMNAQSCGSKDYQCCYGDEGLVDCVDRLEVDYQKILNAVKEIETLDRLEQICTAEREGRLVVLPKPLTTTDIDVINNIGTIVNNLNKAEAALAGMEGK